MGRWNVSKAAGVITLMLAACAQPQPVVIVPPKENDGLSAALANVAKSAYFESSLEGDLSDVALLTKNEALTACKVVRANAASYAGLLLVYARFASRETLEACTQALVSEREPETRAIIKTAMFMLQAAGFAWFMRDDFAAGIDDARLLVAYRRDGLSQTDALVIDAWHSALGLKDKRRTVDLSALRAP